MRTILASDSLVTIPLGEDPVLVEEDEGKQACLSSI